MAFGKAGKKRSGRGLGADFLTTRVGAGGEVEALYLRDPTVEPAFTWRGAGGEATPLAVFARSQADVGLDLLDAHRSDGRRRGAAWKLSGAGRRAKSGRNFAEGWSIPGTDTWWARTEGAGQSSFQFIDPETKGATPITPGGEYVFEVLAATHRCRAQLVLGLADRAGRIIEQLGRLVSPVAPGGRQAEAYDAIEVAFRAPAEAERLVISFSKGGGAADGDSFLFVAAPRLRAGWGRPSPPIQLNDDILTGLRQAVRTGRLIEAATLRPHGLVEGGRLRLNAGDRAAEADVAPGTGPRTGAIAPLIIISALEAAIDHDRMGDADGRHVVALRTWLARAGEGLILPDLNMIKSTLDAGVNGRTDLPTLAFRKSAEPRVSVVLNAGDDLETAWLSLAALLFAAGRAPFEVIVTDASADLAKQLKALVKGVAVQSTARTMTRDAQVRAAVKTARASHLVFLGSGFEPVSGWLDEMLAVFDHFADVAGVVPKTVSSHGRLLSAGEEISAKGDLTARGEGGNPRDPAHGYVRPVDAGAPMMVERTAWEAAGGFDATFTELRLAQADLAARLGGQGRRVLLAPTAELWRLKGVTAAHEPPIDQVAAFKARWAPAYGAPGQRGRHPLRVLFIDQEAPTVDMDAGGYAAFQEIRLLQAMGAQVDFLPKNMAWMDRHTIALERAGVRCHYAPFARTFDGFLRDNANTYDAIFVLRYKVARLVQQALDGVTTRPRLILNLADLHFLREAREAAAGSPGFTEERALATRDAELAAIEASDLTLSYSDVEAAVIDSHTVGRATVARAPWVVEARAAPIGRPGPPELMFLGGFGHPPNVEAVKAFVRDCMPLIVERSPAARLTIVGSKAPPEVLALAGPHVSVAGYVPDLDEVFARARVFVAPLIAGAGLKGKVIEAMARGVPIVLSPVAAEGTGLVDGADCLIPRTSAEWAEAVERLCRDDGLWMGFAEAGLAAARTRFSFDAGVEAMREALAQVGLFGTTDRGLHYLRALPDRHGGAPAAPAVLRQQI